MKLFQYDKKVWDDGDTDHTWQFGIFKNRSLLWMNYESPGRIIHSSGGVNILLSFFGYDKGECEEWENIFWFWQYLNNFDGDLEND